MHKPVTEISPLTAQMEQNKIPPKGHDKWQSQQSEALRSPPFYPVIRDIFSIEAEKAEKTIVLHGQVVDSQLQLCLPAVESGASVMVNDNEIILDGLRLVIDLVDDDIDGLNALF